MVNLQGHQVLQRSQGLHPYQQHPAHMIGRSQFHSQHTQCEGSDLVEQKKFCERTDSPEGPGGPLAPGSPTNPWMAKKHQIEPSHVVNAAVSPDQ